MEQTTSQPGASPSFHINEAMVQAKLDSLKLEQNLFLGLIGGAAGGLIGAAAWAAITYFTEYSIGWMAVGVGFLVGYGMRLLGKGIDKVFGIAGGLIALVSVVLGNFLVVLAYVAQAYELTIIETLLSFNYSMTFELMAETFSIMDLLFYAIAVYEGYKFSFRRVTREELLEGAVSGGPAA